MTYIPQHQLENLRRYLESGKVLVLYGARRVGKTTLIQRFLETLPPGSEKVLFVNGDDIVVRQFLESQSIQKLRDFVGDHTLLVVDEAQYVQQIGLNLKLLIDNLPALKIIATGSSSLNLAKDIGEPLTGRKYTLRLFPLAQMEISQIEKVHESEANLEARLIYGSYPEVVTTPDNFKRQAYLRELVSAYLYKDILELEGIRYAQKLVQILQLLAHQIGREVSFNELATQLGMSKNTVERYIDLLEKVFVIYRRNGFSRNLRKEISKNPRYYFYDNGIRNAVIGNFTPLNLRNDVGELWENYLITERMKKNEYEQRFRNSFFWRTYDRKEIDLVEEHGGKLFGYEIKWQLRKTRAPRDWKNAYPGATFLVIHRENYREFII
ncbi:MAG: ATP-binding protein [Calditrichaeota bacterium]|nr:ATP-binding protein [Calditrichota bacterium]MCB9090323.1 ATP-binding protein [Calditrichia bacterium]